jgi:hypothetical protein
MTCEVRGNRLALAGSIDEHAQLVRLIDHAIDRRLVLDLAEIEFINSLGVREWIRMQQAAAHAQVRIELVRVAEVIVHQLNIVPAARGVSVVTSFMAPYVCDGCDAEHAILLDVRTHGSDLAKRQAPALECPECRGDLELAHPASLYFMFLGE